MVGDTGQHIRANRYPVVRSCLGVCHTGASLIAGSAPELIIDTLLNRVEIANPGYWVNVLNGREQVNIKYLNTLFARFAGFDV